MKRLLGQIGITYLSVLAVVFYFGTDWAWILSALFLLAFVVTLSVSKLRTTVYLPVMTFVALVACVVNVVFTNCVYNKTINDYDAYSGQVCATLTEEPYEFYSTYCYEFKADTIDDEPADVKFALFYDELIDIEAFDKITADVVLRDGANAKLISNGCFLTAYFDDDEAHYSVTKGEHKRIYYYAIRLRQAMRRTLDDMLSDDTFAFCSALLIGDKYALSDTIRQDFLKSGASHLVVVSGMHFSLLVSVFLILAKKLKRNKALTLIPAVLFIILYMSITGYSPSVMRSGIMLLIYILGIMISRDVYSVNSLGIAALVVTAPNPYSVGDVGLILSFATTFAIITLAPRLYSKFHKRIYKDAKNDSKVKLYFKKALSVLCKMLCMNICAFVVSLPLSILFFDAVSTVSIISTFVLCYLLQVLLVLSLVLCLTFWVPFFAPLLCYVIELLTKLSLYLVSLFADFPFSYLYVTRDFVYIWLVMSLLLCVFTYFIKSKDRVKVLSLSCAFILLVGYLSAVFITDKTTTLNVYDVDNGCAVTYSSSDTYAVLSLDCNKINAVSTIGKMKDDTAQLDFYSSVADTTNSLNSLVNCGKEFAISSVLLYDTKREVSLPNTIVDVTTLSDVHTVYLSDAVITYYPVGEVYITYLDSEKGSVLILPQYIDAVDIPDKFRTADTIVMRNCPLNAELLSCDTLIISATQDRAYNIMKFAHSISDRVLLTAEGDLRLIMEV